MNKLLRRLRLAGYFSPPLERTDLSSSLQTANGFTSDYSQSAARSFGNKIKKFSKFSRNSPLIPLIIVVAIVILIAYFAITNLFNSTSSTSVLGNNQAVIQKPKASQILNKEFAFSLKDGNGVVVSKLKYVVQNAELRDEIIVKGQKATTVKGRTFLILNLKITNDYQKSVQINARDYVRLIVNNSSEKLAPDIHNDPVEVQAISTKYTRLGLPINMTDTNLTLQVGEVEGKKELIKLFPK